MFHAIHHNKEKKEPIFKFKKKQLDHLKICKMNSQNLQMSYITSIFVNFAEF